MKTIAGKRARSTASAVGALILLAGASATGPALAQPASQPTPSQAAAAVDRVAPNPIDEVEIRIADLHRKMQITPEQEPRFKAYADALRANAQAMQGLFAQRTADADMSASARLHWYARLTATHAENINRLVPLFDALYQGLSEPQKQGADAAFEELRQRRAARRAQ